MDIDGQHCLLLFRTRDTSPVFDPDGYAMTCGACILQPYGPEPQIYCAFETCRPGAEMISSGKIGCGSRI